MHTVTENNIAVVSGGSGYLGQAIVKELAHNSFSVAVLYRGSNREELESFCAALPGTHRTYQCDVGNKEMLVNVFDSIEKDMGIISVSIHTASQKPKRKQLLASSVDDLKNQYEGTILPGFVFLTTSGERLKKNKGGTLVGITTAGVIRKEATSSLGAYVPAKYAIQGMLTMLQAELAPVGVGVYSVAPGFMAGGMNADIPEAFVAMLREKGATKKLITREDVAKRVVDICLHQDTYKDTFTSLLAPELE